MEGFIIENKNRQKFLDGIVNVETDMFMRLNTAEPIPEDRIAPFKMMRWMTYSVLSNETLESYYNDLKSAKIAGRNLLTEKYAIIDNLMPHIKNHPLIYKIVKTEVDWMKDLVIRYPNTIKREEANAELFERYAVCELETYSDQTIELYFKDVEKAKQEGRNFGEERYNNLYRRIGRGTLKDLEEQAKVAIK